MIRPLSWVIATLSLAGSAFAQDRPDFRVTRAVEAPRIDGDLSDAAWPAPLPLSDWISYNPLRGDKGPERTEVRVTYDDRYLYFGFHCITDDPDAIRATLARRDDAFDDDWVGVSLDSTGGGQTAYHLFVNPRGVQMDAVQTVAAGEQFENDLVWKSAGRRIADGFTVEIAIPLESIRFSGGHEVRMGILFFRHVSRSGVSYSWPDMPPGQWVFNRHAHLVFDQIAERRLVEVLPSATLPITQQRATPRRWAGADANPELGLSAKVGITSNVMLDATVNPDFSQVESDAFQVLVNQRFPVYFSEKRPFFMEGLGLFNLAGTSGDGNMRSAVHTRRIVNPEWGAKLTGTSGRFNFGVLSANDETPEDLGARGAGVEGKSKLFSIARGTYALGTANYAGVIFADTEHAGRRNQASGGDINLRLTSRQQVNATYIHTTTSLDGGADARGDAAQATYEYDSRRWFSLAQAEHYDDGFQMDTAFYNRTGFDSVWAFNDVSFYPEAAKRFGLIRVHPFVWMKRGHDRLQNGDEGVFMTGVRFNATRQGFVNLDTARSFEPWLGKRYDTSHTFSGNGTIQLFDWLSLFSFFRTEKAIRYDLNDPFQGRSKSGGVTIGLQPNQHINQSVDYQQVRFRHDDTGAEVFTVHIINSKSIYQFDRHFQIRLLEQYDSERRSLLTDLLGSYEFVPGTVFFAGYGSLAEDRGFDGFALTKGLVPGNFLTVQRGLFFKASFLHRF